MTKPKQKTNPNQTSLFDQFPRESAPLAPATEAPPKKQPEKEHEPATDLMKKVAGRTKNVSNMKKVFSPDEIMEIMSQPSGQSAKKVSEEIQKEREHYRAVKRKVREMEENNKSQVIVFRSITNNGYGEWYKVIDFSALYYVHRLAPRMGRKARLLKDSDHFSKAFYSASFQDIEKFKAQIKQLGEATLEETLDGVLIFKLKRPLTDDEVGALRRVEEERRDRMHNILKPKAMDPAAYQAILACIRQIGPKVNKLNKANYWTTGEGMMKELNDLMAVYFDFADGVVDRREAGVTLLRICNRLLSGLANLSENRVWPYDAASAIGENLNLVKRIVGKNFGVWGNDRK